MSLKIRLSRGGRKKRPYYSIVVADSRMPRDGRYIEKVGSYNPLLAKDDEKRVVLNEERVKYWLGEGAQSSDRVSIFLGKAGLIDMPAQRNNPNKGEPSEHTKMLKADKEEKLKAKAEAEAEAKASAEEAPAEEAPAEEAPAEEAPAE